MAYLGGKARSANYILDILNAKVFDNLTYIEPFVGYAHILRRVKNKKKYIAYDKSPLLVTLLKAVQKKRHLPHVNEKEWRECKKNGKTSLKCALACYTHSLFGIPFSQYLGPVNKNSKYHNSSGEARRYYSNKLQTSSSFMKANIRQMDFLKLKNVKNCLIFCDPPYPSSGKAINKEYKQTIDTESLWAKIRKLSKHNYVFVCERKAPKGFVCVSSVHKANFKRMYKKPLTSPWKGRECLFVVRNSPGHKMFLKIQKQKKSK